MPELQGVGVFLNIMLDVRNIVDTSEKIERLCKFSV